MLSNCPQAAKNRIISQDLIDTTISRDSEMIATLLTQTTLFDAKYEAFETAIHLGYNHIITVFLKHFSKEENGKILMRACELGSITVVNILLTHHLEISLEDKGWSLAYANMANNKEIISVILSQLSYEDLSLMLIWADENALVNVIEDIVNFLVMQLKQKTYSAVILGSLTPNVLSSIMLDYTFSSIEPLLSALTPELIKTVGLTKEKIDEAILAGRQQAEAECAENSAQSSNDSNAASKAVSVTTATSIAPVIAPSAAPAAPLLLIQNQPRRTRKSEVELLELPFEGLRRSARLAKKRAEATAKKSSSDELGFVSERRKKKLS